MMSHSKHDCVYILTLKSSVTRLGDLLDFWPLFVAFGNN